MDTEGQENYHMFQSSVQKKLKRLFYQPHQPQQKISLSIPPRRKNDDDQHEQIDNVIRKHGMPWKESIDTTLKITTDDESKSNLLYMPFWIHQLDYMKNHLTNLKLLPCTDFHEEYDFTFHENPTKKARIHNLHFTSDEYRKIRMTYYDNGHKVQVFNSLWYPSNYNNNSTPLPVLGIDLLQFNKKKHLVVIDFQPIIVNDNDDDHDSDNNYENILKSIRDKYPTLQGQMSNRFYDETQFFSKQMLFSRFDSTSSTTNENDDNDNDDNNDNDNNVLTNELMPAFQQYISTHVDMVKKQSSNMKENKEETRQRRKKNKTSHKQQNHQQEQEQYEYVLQRQEAYDIYSAHRDPATKMFENMFGKEWADKFVHEFLFSLSRKS